jgi:hypothetical protein
VEKKKKKKSVLFYLGFRTFADQFESLLVRERERDSFFFPLARMPSEVGAEKWVLPAHDKLQKGKKLMLIILDGWGEQIADQFNAIAVAKTPIMDHLKTTAPERWRLLKAHGPAVGLPTEDDMGNSEVGHNALGAGRIFKQGWVRRRKPLNPRIFECFV